MNMLFQILPSTLMKAIGWTLLHSIWQGLVIALLLALLLICLQRSSAAIRYFMATGALLTFTCISLLTFVTEYWLASIPTQDKITHTSTSVKALGFPIEVSFAKRIEPLSQNWPITRFYPTFQAYFQQHLPFIVLLWAMGMALLIIRFAGGYAYTQRLKNYKTVALPQTWQQTLATLAMAARISQPVKLMESALVKVPMVVGYLKPVILLPVGTIIGLPAEQVEAILAHELAHIYRKDYLVNIFQCIIEIVFFYHPGIWWISSRIREEREHCCDDLALSICGNTLTFAKALANLEQVAHHTPALALGFPGKGKQLLSRIKRLGNAQVRKPDFMEGFLAACFVMLSISAISVSAGINKETNLMTISGFSSVGKNWQEPATNAIQSNTDTTKNTFTFNGASNGKRYKIEAVTDKGKIVALTVNGNKVPPSDIDQYQELIAELMGAVPVPTAPLAPIMATAPEIAVLPEPVISPSVAEAPAIRPAISGPVPAPPHPVHPALAPMAPADISQLIRAAFNGDTSKKVKGDFVYHFSGKKNQAYKITIKDGVITELKVDGKKIPKNEYATYAYLADELEVDSPDRQMAFHAKQEALLARQQELMDLQVHLESENMQRIAKLQERQLEAINRQHEEFSVRDQQMQKQLQAQDEVMRKQELAMEKAMEQHEKAIAKHDESARLSQELIGLLNTHLVKDKLISPDKTHYIQISPKGLYIDSVRQSDQVFKKYKSLLEKKTGKPLDFTIQYYANQEQDKDSSSMLWERTDTSEEKGMVQHREAMKMHDELIDLLNTYLTKENLLSTNKKHHISINAQGLYIDNVLQPEKTFNAYKALIEKKTGKPFEYSVDYEYTSK